MKNLERLLKRVKQTVHNIDSEAVVMLYGSYARGTANIDSDLDLMILVNREQISFTEEKEIMHPLYHIGYEEDIIISPWVCTRTFWQQHSVTPFTENINREARIL